MKLWPVTSLGCSFRLQRRLWSNSAGWTSSSDHDWTCFGNAGSTRSQKHTKSSRQVEMVLCLLVCSRHHLDIFEKWYDYCHFLIHVFLAASPGLGSAKISEPPYACFSVASLDWGSWRMNTPSWMTRQRLSWTSTTSCPLVPKTLTDEGVTWTKD